MLLSGFFVMKVINHSFESEKSKQMTALLKDTKTQIQKDRKSEKYIQITSLQKDRKTKKQRRQKDREDRKTEKTERQKSLNK